MNSASRAALPAPPPIKALDRISPTIYEAAIRCTSRAAWIAGGDRKLLPQHPRSLLGIGVHTVLERARQGRIIGETEDERRAAAEHTFDQKLRDLFAGAHPLIHVKFEAPDRLPFYNLYRARAAEMAVDMFIKIVPRAMNAGPARTGSIVEASLLSKDGRVTGRADVLDPAKETVIEYKTGLPSDSSPISETEVRQLRLYAFLASENGMTIRRGVIERANRVRVEIDISAAQAAEEGRKALAVLDQYNTHVGGSFEDAASPSQEACRFCPCIPFCNAFWNNAAIEWLDQCGAHAEGVVESVEGTELVSINLMVTRGSVPRGSSVVTRLSREWLTFAGSNVPRAQEIIRVTGTAYVAGSTAPAILRADRAMTAVWTIPADATESGNAS